MSDDIFDTGIDMEPLRAMMRDWHLHEMAHYANGPFGDRNKDLRRLEFQIVEYVRQADWNRQMAEADEFAEKRRVAKENESAD